MDWAKLWDDIVNFFTGNVWSIVGFFAALLIGIIFIKIAVVVLRRIFARTSMEKIAQQFVLAIVKFLLWLVLVLVLLSILGIAVTGIVTAFSAVLLAVGMALESNIANLANGIVIVASHMFKKGDYIIVDGKEGSITNINFLFTTIMTPDNKKVTIPNSTIVNSSVVNAGADKFRRVDFTFSVAYESDVELVKKTVIDCMKSDGRVYDEEGKAPFCRLKTLGSSSLDFFANCWCDNSDYWDVYYNIVETVYNEFKKNNISVPYNQLEVRSRTDDVVLPFDAAPLPERKEKKRAPEEKTGLEKVLYSVSAKTHKKAKKSRKDKDGGAPLDGETKTEAAPTEEQPEDTTEKI